MSFWSNKIAGTPVKSTIPVVNTSLFLYTAQQPAGKTVSAVQSYTPKVKLTQGSICPGCGSDSYKPNHGSFAISCPECGYHPRFEQSGYGESSLQDSGSKAISARQVNSDGFNLKGAFAELNSGGGFHMHKDNQSKDN